MIGVQFDWTDGSRTTASVLGPEGEEVPSWSSPRLRGLGEAFDDSRVQGPVAGTLDYVEQTIAEEAGGIELAAHRTWRPWTSTCRSPLHQGGTTPYHTLAGSVSIERSLYRQSGQRRAPGGAGTFSLRAGVVGAGLAAAHAQVMAHQVQQGPYRWRRPTGRTSRSSVDGCAHRWARWRWRIEDEPC